MSKEKGDIVVTVHKSCACSYMHTTHEGQLAQNCGLPFAYFSAH